MESSGRDRTRKRERERFVTSAESVKKHTIASELDDEEYNKSKTREPY